MTFARRLAHVETTPHEQKMTVQHVHVAEGGQAIVGNVNAPAEGGGAVQKTGDQPHALGYAPALRCRAKSKRSGLQCRAPAVRRSSVCRMHGAGGGAPRGNKNAWRHGNYSAEAIETRRTITALMRQTRQLVEALGIPG
jgi:uncharacterized protein YjcR